MTKLAKAEQGEQMAFEGFGLPGEITAVSLTLPPDLSWEEWERGGRLLGRLVGGTRWWVSDLFNFGEGAYGEKYAQMLDAVGYDQKTISNILWVGKRIAPEIRREELSFSHHEVVAVLERPEDQAKWLQKAIDNGWTRDELRARLKGKEPKDADNDPQNRAPLSEKRQQECKEAIEAVVGRWWTGLVKDKEVALLSKDQAFRAREFERLANLSVRALVEVLGG